MGPEPLLGVFSDHLFDGFLIAGGIYQRVGIAVAGSLLRNLFESLITWLMPSGWRTMKTGTTGAPAIIARRSKPLGVAASSPKNGTQMASDRFAF